MVSKAVEEAKSLGANGIISFEIKRVHDVKKNNSDMDTYYVQPSRLYTRNSLCSINRRMIVCF